MSFHHSPRIVTDGLIMCLDATSKKSYSGAGSTWTDISNNGNHGTLNGTYSLTTVENAQGILFTNGSLPVSYLIQNNTINFRTISMWYNRRSGAYGSEYILDTRPIMTGGYLWHGGFGPDWDPCTVYQNGQDISTGKILNSLIGYDTGLLSIGGWRNVTIVAKQNFTSTINFFSRFSNDEAPSVILPHVTVYNKALSPDEILQNYNALKGRFGL